MNKQTEVNSGMIPGVGKTYEDLAVLLSSFLKTFQHHSSSVNEEIKEDFFRMNCYLNTLAHRYKIQTPVNMAANDAKWYQTAVSHHQSEEEVYNALNSFYFDFKVKDQEVMTSLSKYVKKLVDHGLMILN